MSLEKASIRDKLRSIPIVKRVTIWYTIFILILFIFLMFTTFFVVDEFVIRDSEEELKETVEKYVDKPFRFRNFDDGILLSLYDEKGYKIRGEIPMDLKKQPDLKDGQISTFQSNDKSYISYDRFVSNKEHKIWIRGIIPLDKVHREKNNMIMLLLFVSPIFIIIVLYGGYKITKNAFKPVRVITGTARDIGERKDFSKRIDIGTGKDEIYEIATIINEMLSSLEKSYIAEKEFSSNVSHELRTPLTVILSESQYALYHTQDIEERIESLEVINRQSEKMKSMVEQILEISKIENMEHLSFVKEDLSSIFISSLKDYEQLAKDKNIELDIDIEENLEFSCNKTMVVRVIDNMMNNAIKFTNSKIGVSVKDKKEYIEIVFKDDGIGIGKEDVDKIWNRFYQVDQARNKEQNKGSGLGLSLVDKIVKLHKGKIEVQSQLEKGTTFIIKLLK